MKQLFVKGVFFFALLFGIGQGLIANAQVFEVNLFYNPSTKIIKFDEKKAKPVSFNKERELFITEFLQQSELAEGAYAAALYDSVGEELVSTQFEPQKNAFVVELPYFSLASSLKIFDSQTGQELLNASLEEFTSCNGNGICEYEMKETTLSCIGDCARSKTYYSQDTQNLLKQNDGVIKDPETGDTVIKDERFADPTFIQPPPSQPLTTPAPAPSSGSLVAPTPEREVSTVRVVLLVVFTFIAATGIVFFIKKKMK